MIAVAIAAYVSTNIDDLLLLMGFFSAPDYPARAVIVGQFIGIGLLVMFSLGCALAALVIPPASVGLLGCIPICLGIVRLFQRKPDRASQAAPSGPWPVLTVVGATLADGGDNVATYTPIFATITFGETLLVIGVFALMTGLWCWVARSMVGHPMLGRPFRRWGYHLLPCLLVAIGLWVMWKSATFPLVFDAIRRYLWGMA